MENINRKIEEVKRYFQMTKLAIDPTVYKHQLELVELLEENVIKCLEDLLKD